MAEALELTAAIVNAIDKKRGMNIEVLHTTDVTTLADYFVMATAASTTQLRTLSDATEDAAEKLGETPYSVEGERESGWRVLDFSTVIVHLFLPEQREFYSLERLWQDAETVDIAPFLAKPEDA
ncbi:MAG: ribosome silencing factor [Clostridiales bacterium]|nr:ribosome silencing factor [Clostridiales bacterium]